MTEELNYIVQHLLSEGYVIRTPHDHFVFTNKFYSEYTQQDIGAVPVADVAMVKSQTAVIAMPTKAEDVREAYIAFIQACKIPKRAETSTGDVYNLNQYSESGAKAFKKILARVTKGEIDLELLTKATQLYYRSPGYKLKIGNFIGEGAWETHYQEMLESIEKDSLTDHISHTLKHDTTGTSRYRLSKSGGSGKTPDPTRTLGEKPRNIHLPLPNK